MVAVIALALAGSTTLLRGPTVVPRVSIVNGSELDNLVEVSGRDGGGGWTSVTTVDRRSSSQVSDVIDQGELWIFRFRAQGRTGGEIRLARGDLRGAGWSLEIPPEVVDRLRTSGAPATP